MYLYLIQHGEAKSEAEDPARPLSGKGIRDARKVASFISSNTRIDVEYINHSGKVRAALLPLPFQLSLQSSRHD